jgi:putative phosphoesterase
VDKGRKTCPMTQVIVIADTHVRSVRELPAEIRRAVETADWVVHCGDFTGGRVVEELLTLDGRFTGVYGNSDPGEVRRQLPHEATLDLDGRTIAVAHPSWGEYPDGIEDELVSLYPGADAILFGHTHDPAVVRIGGTLLLNPGQAYASFMVPATYAVLTSDDEGLRGEIRIVA